MDTRCSTGLPGLDRILKGVLPGDNVVWQVERWEEYRDLVVPYARAARASAKRLIYFRFASHPELLAAERCDEVHRLDPTEGFEPFVTAVHDVITHSGEGSVCVFDCLSDLGDGWQSDAMLGNFFVLTCPRLLEYQRLTYFGLYRHRHSPLAIAPIQETTQFMLDVFTHQERLYIRPLKVQYRSSQVLNQIHVREGEDFLAVKSSAEIAEVLRGSDWRGLLSEPRPDRWKQVVLDASALVRREDHGQAAPPEETARLFALIEAELIGGEKRMQDLVRGFLRLEDLLAICHRLIGSGRIGGKAVGMILARAILRKETPALHAKLEAHDSFHIGSEVYYSFLIRNGLWWIRQRQREGTSLPEDGAMAKERIQAGTFPDPTLHQLRDMLAYFGESPFIVRSSSLLEDAYGNAFAGKYESVFCVNQGPPACRLEALLDAIRQVYASALGEEAQHYRRRRGLMDRDEQMALLLQRVSGQRYGDHYFPHLAGVGLSFNPYVWHADIDPKAGVLRLVFGLGTRAVDPAGDDHTRLIALNAPELRPSSGYRDVQRKMDCLDLANNRLVSPWFDELARQSPDLPLRLFTSHPPNEPVPILTFEPLLQQTPLLDDLRLMLHTLEARYGVPVDVEFSVNVLRDEVYRINLLQCRPFQIRQQESADLGGILPVTTPWIDARGPVIGTSLRSPVDRVVLVESEAYSHLSVQMQHATAKALGRLNRANPPGTRLLLIGPGRWGTREPSLGVPVRFGDIGEAMAIIELREMHGSLIPDASLGTHFLNELIECDVVYASLRPGETGNRIDLGLLRKSANRLLGLLPDLDPTLADVIRVADISDLHFRADVFHQRVELFQSFS